MKGYGTDGRGRRGPCMRHWGDGTSGPLVVQFYPKRTPSFAQRGQGQFLAVGGQGCAGMVYRWGSPASAVRSLAGIRLVPGRLLVQRVSAFPTARGTLSGWIVGTRYGHTAVVIVLSLCVTLCFINPSINQSMSLCDDPIVPLTCKQAGALVATPVA